MGKALTGTRENILKMAREEFLEKGYKDAWLRDIAARADVTTGALYVYFRNKEELFGALVDDCYNEIQEMYRDVIREFSNMGAEEQRMKIEEMSIEGMLKMADYMYDHHDEFKLLLCCSKETSYADLAEKMALIDREATEDFVKAAAVEGGSVKRITPRLEHILNAGLFTMFFELIMHDVPREEAEEYTVTLVQFFSSGFRRIMGL